MDSTLCEIVNGRWKRRGEHEYREPESNPQTESGRNGNPQLQVLRGYVKPHFDTIQSHNMCRKRLK